MKFRPLAAAILTAVLAAAPAAAQSDIDLLTQGLSSFAEKTLPGLPFAASAGLDWSNAYVGPLFGGDFPYLHGGVGGAIGVTTLPGEAVTPLFQAMGLDGVEVFPMPYAVATLRLGGIILPFDFGLKAGFLPEEYATQVAEGYRFRYQNLGFDVRYSLMKGSFWLPDISAGGGIHYLQIGVARDTENQYFWDGSETLSIENAKINLEMQATVIEAKAQISKTFFFLVTPYAGVSALLGSASALSGLEAVVTTTASDLSYWRDYQVYATPTGFQTEREAATFGVKIFGGFSANLLILKLDLQGMYNLTDGAVGGQLGARLQL